MKRLILTALASLAVAAPAIGQTDAEQFLAKVAAATENALVMVRCKYAGDAGSTILTGIGICYDAAKGDFLTLALGAKFRPEKLEELSIIVPGFENKTIPAEFLGMRPEVGIAFIRAKQPHKWQAVKFAAKSDLKIGQMVASVGLMPGARANTPYLGLAYVSTSLRIPERLYYVTGGRLTCIGSPVFAADGLAVGMIVQNLYMDYEMLAGRRPTTVSMKARQESPFFLPSEEFAHVLNSIPQGGRIPRPAWMGVLKVVGVSDEQAELMELKTPAVMIDQVIPNGPAHKAGLKSGDVLVAFNSQPVERLSSDDLTGRNLLRKIMLSRVGTQVTMTVRRQGQDKQVTVTLGEMPLLPDESPRFFDRELGLAVRQKVPLDRYLGKSSTARTAGLAVIGVGPQTPAANGGLKTGDLVTAINGQPVKTVETFKKILTKSLASQTGAGIVLMIHRGDAEPQAITIQPKTKTKSP